MPHWDLHYGNVLAARREPWPAIDPEPLAGDPGFDLWPALDSRWDDVVVKDGASRVVRRRFDLLTEVLGPDRARATGWTLGRLLQNSLWDIDDGQTALHPSSVTITEALLDRRPRPLREMKIHRRIPIPAERPHRHTCRTRREDLDKIASRVLRHLGSRGEDRAFRRASPLKVFGG